MSATSASSASTRRARSSTRSPSAARPTRRRLGDIIGPGFAADEIVDAVETVVDTYLELRRDGIERIFSRGLSARRHRRPSRKRSTSEARGRHLTLDVSFGDQVAASRLEARFSAVRGNLAAAAGDRRSVSRQDRARLEFRRRFGRAARHGRRIDKSTPVVFIDTGQTVPETLAYRDALVARFGLDERRSRRRRRCSRPRTRRLSVCERPRPLLRDPQGGAARRGARGLRCLDHRAQRRFQSATRAALRCSRPKGIASRSIRSPAGAARTCSAILQSRHCPASSCRQGVSVDRLLALHEPRRARRGSARRPLARARQGGMRHPHYSTRRGADI